MMRQYFQLIVSNPWLRVLVWLLFAMIFYKSGETFTVWLVEPENFAGGLDWLWLVLLPLLVPAFFVINRHCGCASGACGVSKSGIGARLPPGH